MFYLKLTSAPVRKIYNKIEIGFKIGFKKSV